MYQLISIETVAAGAETLTALFGVATPLSASSSARAADARRLRATF